MPNSSALAMKLGTIAQAQHAGVQFTNEILK